MNEYEVSESALGTVIIALQTFGIYYEIRSVERQTNIITLAVAVETDATDWIGCEPVERRLVFRNDHIEIQKREIEGKRLTV